MTKAFISHSSKDNFFSQKIAELLSELGVNVWIDVADIRGGTNWGDQIQLALDECDLMLLVLSPDSMASGNVKQEWQYYYLGVKKPLIPLLFRPAKIPYQLYGLQYVDFVNRTFIAAFAELCMTLKSRGFRVGSSGKQRPVFEAGTPHVPRPSLAAGQLTALHGDNPLPLLPPNTSSGAAGITVGQLHVIPPHMRRVDDILPPPFEWIEISDGELTLLDGRLNQDAAFPLPTYSMARYPITNAQYCVFIEADDGYREAYWWDFSDGARGWRALNPHPRRSSAACDDHPRTGVSWYEAVAYCRWLAYRVAAQQTVANITLPTVQQWHWAAVADTRWSYPWGGHFVRHCCNTAESELWQTTPVTQYPWGASTYGVMDMCGNSWDWCLNDWVTGLADIRQETSRRFVMGGSWRDTRDFARVQHQPCSQPGVRKNTQGFRIAATFARL